MKEMDSQLNKWQKQQQVNRSHGMDSDLRSHLVQTKYPRQQDHRKRCKTHRRVDTENYAHRQTPRETTRRYPTAQLQQQWTQYLALEDLSYGLGNRHNRL